MYEVVSHNSQDSRPSVIFQGDWNEAQRAARLERDHLIDCGFMFMSNRNDDYTWDLCNPALQVSIILTIRPLEAAEPADESSEACQMAAQMVTSLWIRNLREKTGEALRDYLATRKAMVEQGLIKG